MSNATFSPGLGGDLWVLGLAMTGFASIFGAVNFIATIITMRAPRHDHVPDADLHLERPHHLILALMAFPVLAAALFGLAVDRLLGGQIYNPEAGGALLWQHLFWFFGHPEVYIIASPRLVGGA
ncbi:cbb3-type cytochrome c oxidase subunit I [Georgenia sp. SUBG003]|uniref:cbb3-type cytochrome c oxidase subunit I n=1 Tax=Georgenia sp. SUBG003 TaxID=1497974 RepID=UPI003AB70234